MYTSTPTTERRTGLERTSIILNLCMLNLCKWNDGEQPINIFRSVESAVWRHATLIRCRSNPTRGHNNDVKFENDNAPLVHLFRARRGVVVHDCRYDVIEPLLSSRYIWKNVKIQINKKTFACIHNILARKPKINV